MCCQIVFVQAEDGIRDLVRSRGLGDVYKRQLLRRRSTLDIVRVQDTVLFGASDFVVLEWANQNGRVLLTHDVNTVTKIAYERLRVGEPTVGVIAVPQSVPIGQVIEDIPVSYTHLTLPTSDLV